MKRKILVALLAAGAVAGALAPATAKAAPRKAFPLPGYPCAPCPLGGGEFPGLCSCQINDPIIIYGEH